MNLTDLEDTEQYNPDCKIRRWYRLASARHLEVRVAEIRRRQLRVRPNTGPFVPALSTGGLTLRAWQTSQRSTWRKILPILPSR